MASSGPVWGEMETLLCTECEGMKDRRGRFSGMQMVRSAETHMQASQAQPHNELLGL